MKSIIVYQYWASAAESGPPATCAMVIWFPEHKTLFKPPHFIQSSERFSIWRFGLASTQKHFCFCLFVSLNQYFFSLSTNLPVNHTVSHRLNPLWDQINMWFSVPSKQIFVYRLFFLYLTADQQRLCLGCAVLGFLHVYQYLHPLGSQLGDAVVCRPYDPPYGWRISYFYPLFLVFHLFYDAWKFGWHKLLVKDKSWDNCTKISWFWFRLISIFQ